MGFSLNPFKNPALDPLDLFGGQARAQSKRDQAMLADAQAEQERKDALRASINKLYGIGDTGDPDVQKALAGFGAEETDLSGALRGYYGDEAKKRYQGAERGIRFNLGDRGLIGGSVHSDQLTDLEEANRLGGTRTEEAVQRALNSLRSSRESSRLSAMSLANAGQGEEGVRSAAAGLTSSLDAAKAAGREDIFSDLFSNLSSAKQIGDARSRDQQLAAYFQRGRTTPSSLGGTNQSAGGPAIVNYG